MKQPPIHEAVADNRDSGSQEGRPVSGVRRRLVQGGLSSGALLVTLSSRPVLAADCFSPSETVSGNLSATTGEIPQCSGQSATFWLEAAGTSSTSSLTITSSGLSWPVSTSTPFYSVFARGPYAEFQALKPDPSLLEVMERYKKYIEQNKSVPMDVQMGFHFVGAYLNILADYVDPRALDVSGLLGIWNEWVSLGSYTPYAGAPQWDAGMILQYLSDSSIVTTG